MIASFIFELQTTFLETINPSSWRYLFLTHTRSPVTDDYLQEYHYKYSGIVYSISSSRHLVDGKLQSAHVSNIYDLPVTRLCTVRLPTNTLYSNYLPVSNPISVFATELLSNILVFFVGQK